ncbi:MAG: hypothetical protein U0411_07920 [Thermodesulfovibrionales bacterium]
MLASRVPDIEAVDSPSMETVPSVGKSSPPIRWRRVVLPEPEDPAMQTNSPLSTERLTPRSAGAGTPFAS